jgi:hypothetical protein
MNDFFITVTGGAELSALSAVSIEVVQAVYWRVYLMDFEAYGQG